jgi:hypothetical protein
MNRGARRKVLKAWRKILDSSFFDSFCYDAKLPYSVRNCFFKVDCNLLACVSWDWYGKSYLRLAPVFDGVPHFSGCTCIFLGLVSDKEREKVLGERDEDFEFLQVSGF